ncbi:DUF3857 domain-containing transglutaminase family protein [Calditrichota bacterium]
MISCVKKSNWDSQIEWQELEFSKLPSQKDFPDEAAIILHDEAKIETFGDKENGFTVYEKHRIMKILNTRGYKYASVAIPYTPRSGIEILQARTISPSGKISVVKEENIYDISLYPNFMLYSDQMAKLFTFPAVENGSIVEYRYAVHYKGHTYGSAWNFQESVPVLLSKYTMIIPSEVEPVYRISGIEIEPDVKKGPIGFKSTYIWQAKNLSPLKSEIGMPVTKKVAARLNIASANTKTWTDVANWYKDLSQPQMRTSDEIKNLVARITKGMVDQREKLKIIYEWVRDNIRYVSVAIGIGSYQPHAAESILFNRYGDCKDMTTLLCTMAKEADLEVHQVLIGTWYNGRVDTSLASVSQFNHAIAYCPTVGENGTWIDATDKACPFEQLPWYDADMPVLLVKDEGDSEIMFTPRVTYNENRKQLEWIVNLDSAGAALIEGKNMLWGASASELRYDLMSQSASERKIWMETYLSSRCALIKLDSLSIIGIDPIKDPLIISYKFSSQNFANVIKNRMNFCPGDISEINLSDYFLSEERQHPIRFRFGAKTKMNITMNIPEEWTIETEDFSHSLSSSFGQSSWNWFESDNKFYIQSEFILEGNLITPEEYLDFKNYLDSTHQIELKEVSFIKKEQ